MGTGMLPAGVGSVEVNTSRSRVHVLTSGERDEPTLVLIHGNVSSSRFFAETMAVLGQRWHCVAPDLRGFGRSQRLPVDSTRGLRDYSDDLHALLTESDLVPAGRKVVLLGWSLGAGVVMRYAIDHPEALAGLVLEAPVSPYGYGGTKDVEGTPCWPDFAGSGGGTVNQAMVDRIAAGDRGAESGASPRRVITGVYGAPPFELAPEVLDEYVEAILEMAIDEGNYPGDSVATENWPGIAPGTRGVNNALSPKYCDLSALGDLSTNFPILWVHGDADAIVGDAAGGDFGTLGRLGVVPGWPGEDVYPPQPMIGQTRAVLDRYRAGGGSYREEVLAGCGHSPHLERPEVFHALVEELLTQAYQQAQGNVGSTDSAGLAS